MALKRISNMPHYYVGLSLLLKLCKYMDNYLVCVSGCLFVHDCSRTTGYEAAYERHKQLQCSKGMKNNVAILLKRLRSRDMA